MRRLLLLLLLSPLLGWGQTIAEKKRSFEEREKSALEEEQLMLLNELLAEKRQYIASLYAKGREFHEASDRTAIQALLQEIQSVRAEIEEIEENWKDETLVGSTTECYSLWNESTTTVAQLMADYGGEERLYIIPPEIGAMAISLSSRLPIPRELWSDCLELILASEGIGIRKLSPFVSELFFLQGDCSRLKGIVNTKEELELFPKEARLCFVLTPRALDPRSDLLFLQKFSNPAHTMLSLVGGNIFIIDTAEVIAELLKLHDFVSTQKGGQEVQLVTLAKMSASEMETVLNCAFYESARRAGGEEGSTLRILPVTSLPRALFLFGSGEEIAKAQKLIRELEAQIEDPNEKTVFWYTVRHSDAQELAGVLAKVYDLLIEGGLAKKEGDKKTVSKELTKVAEQAKNLVVSPAGSAPGAQGGSNVKTADGKNNFIVDPKTGSIIMVVLQEALPKIKELLKKLDVPKRMVQIEVLLFEKKISKQNKFGLNLLRLGSAAAAQSLTPGAIWNPSGVGILEFLVSHKQHGRGVPSFDLAYNFLLGQEDIQINASPSITTVNQTPATIAIVEEISLNMGVSSEDKKKESFQRAQYGITIQITPTINNGSEDEESADYITLDSDITFDTTKKIPSERPDVTRRHIKNHVRVADGETVILGGLRRKTAEDNKESIPFLGEIPGLGKLFSTTELAENSTEMFIFITPRVIADPYEEAERMRREELRRRPGDLPEFIHEILEAKEREKKRLFEAGLTALFGSSNAFTTSCRGSYDEYDGR